MEKIDANRTVLIRDVLAVVVETQSDEPALRAGEALASAGDGRLTALLIALRPHGMGEMDAGRALAAWIEEAHDDAIKEKRRLTDRLKRVATEHELRFVETERHLAARRAAIHARHADLAIFTRPEDHADPRRELIETVLFGSGRPLLVVPPRMDVAFNPQRILVAWNASREAARALADAAPFLRKAKSVRLITVNAAPSPEGDGEAPEFDVAAHLARHGVDAGITNVHGVNRPDGEVILAEAAQFGADLVVLGGYGRSRLQETIFGGVTKFVLMHANVPLLLSH